VALGEPSAGRLRILVSDTGPGIPADRLDRLFKPFERLHADQMGVEGIGLGLALSKRLVEAMGGQIGVETTVGAGSTFWVELPLVQSPLELPGLAVTGAVEENGPARTVLYVEDNLTNVRLVERILARRPGVRLLTAMQGRLGLDLIREHRPDLVLLDIHLSDLQGDEVMRLLREDARTREIPIVVISATEDARILKHLIAEGARAYLTKPLDAQRLLTLVDEILPVPVAGEQRS
jgi:signal transduction histidine kinase